MHWFPLEIHWLFESLSIGLCGTAPCCRAVGLLQQYITLTLYHQQTLTAGVQAATRLLGMINEANQVGHTCERLMHSQCSSVPGHVVARRGF